MINDYLEHGWQLCAIKPGTKQPHGHNWQKTPLTDNPPDGYGIGLIHGLNNTCAIDIDQFEHARIALAGLGVDLDDLLDAPDAVQIQSRPGRAKLLYRLPEDVPAKRHNLNWPDENGDKTHCVIEFRAGDVQDILPPSMHPDTGAPYEWAGSGHWRDLPVLPEPLARAWRQWDLARDAMRDACPWRKQDKPHVPVKRYSVPTEGGNVIGAFNAAHAPADVLDQHGYKQAGNRWLAPSSETGIPGVVALDGEDGIARVYSHHASDVLSDGHAHDAFSVYCQLAHNGNVTAAVAQAGDDLGIDRPHDPEAAQIADRIMQGRRNVVQIPKKQEPESQTIDAPDPGPIPSPSLRNVETYIRASVHAYKGQAVTQAVLSFACHQAARRYQTRDGQPVAAFLGVFDSSVAGLRALKGPTYWLCGQFGPDERLSIRGTHIPSANTVYTHLSNHPRLYWMTDDYGYMLANHRRQTSGAMAGVLGVLHEAHTGQTLFVDPDTIKDGNKRDIKDCDIFAPSVTLMAMLSGDQVASMATRSEYGRGTLQQMMLCPAGEQHYNEYGHAKTTIPTGLIDWQKRIADIPGIPGAEQSAHQPPHLQTVHWGDGIGALIKEAHADLMAYMSTPERREWRGMAHGYIQTAIRVGSAIAAWNNPEAPVIEAPVMRWALDWAQRCLMLTMPQIEISSPSGDPDVMQRVMETLWRKERAMSDSELRRSCSDFKRLSLDERDSLMNALEANGWVELHRRDNKKKGGPETKRWVAKTKGPV